MNVEKRRLRSQLNQVGYVWIIPLSRIKRLTGMQINYIRQANLNARS